MNKAGTAADRYAGWTAGLVMLFISSAAWAHDPIFGIGPHVLYEGGVEVAPETHVDKQGRERGTETGLELTYGITGDWAAGIDLPYSWQKAGAETASGVGDLRLFTKYRFWRHDTLGAQETAAVLLKVKFDTGDEDASPAIGTGTTDTILGLTYGYESRKWYRWAGLRYRFNDENDIGLERGDKILFDLVGGIRLKPTGYLQPDTVWLLELNGEYGSKAELNSISIDNTGGTAWFVSPGVFWTKRNFAVKAGVQIPVYSDLNGNQDDTDYRAKLILEWHL